MFTNGGVAIKYEVLPGVACFSHPRGLIYMLPCQEIYLLLLLYAHVLFHSIYMLGLNINMRITATTVALLLHHAAEADKASKGPAIVNKGKSGKGKAGKGTAAPTGAPTGVSTEGPTAAPTGVPTGALCTSANSFNNTSLRDAVKDYFDQECITKPSTCEIIRQYGVIGGWRVCEVTDMQELFSYLKYPDSLTDSLKDFNQPLNDWDISKVTTMSYMFSGAAAYNQPMNGWDVSDYYGFHVLWCSSIQPAHEWLGRVQGDYYV